MLVTIFTESRHPKRPLGTQFNDLDLKWFFFLLYGNSHLLNINLASIMHYGLLILKMKSSM